jgi:hypothetical protein
MRLFSVVAAVAVGVLGLAPVASANTGQGGFTVLYASTNGFAHVCQVISSTSDKAHQAVVCADLTVTFSSGGVNYQVTSSAEAYCQTPAGAAEACDSILVSTVLSVGDGSYTSAAIKSCGYPAAACSAGRLTATSDPWGYNIHDAGQSDGQYTACDGSGTSSYNVWGLVVGWDDPTFKDVQTTIVTPDGQSWTVGLAPSQAPNDGVNESTGHYYVCP